MQINKILTVTYLILTLLLVFHLDSSAMAPEDYTFNIFLLLNKFILFENSHLIAMIIKANREMYDIQVDVF